MINDCVIMNTFEVINKRRSVRSFSDEKIDENDLEKIIETGKIAPVAGKFQITVVQNKEILNKLNDAVKEALKASGDEARIAQAENSDYNAFYGANTFVLFSAPDENLLEHWILHLQLKISYWQVQNWD